MQRPTRKDKLRDPAGAIATRKSTGIAAGLACSMILLLGPVLLGAPPTKGTPTSKPSARNSLIVGLWRFEVHSIRLADSYRIPTDRKRAPIEPSLPEYKIAIIRATCTPMGEYTAAEKAEVAKSGLAERAMGWFKNASRLRLFLDKDSFLLAWANEKTMGPRYVSSVCQYIHAETGGANVITKDAQGKPEGQLIIPRRTKVEITLVFTCSASAKHPAVFFLPVPLKGGGVARLTLAADGKMSGAEYGDFASMKKYFPAKPGEGLPIFWARPTAASIQAAPKLKGILLDRILVRSDATGTSTEARATRGTNFVLIFYDVEVKGAIVGGNFQLNYSPGKLAGFCGMEPVTESQLGEKGMFAFRPLSGMYSGSRQQAALLYEVPKIHKGPFILVFQDQAHQRYQAHQVDTQSETEWKLSWLNMDSTRRKAAAKWLARRRIEAKVIVPALRKAHQDEIDSAVRKELEKAIRGLGATVAIPRIPRKPSSKPLTTKPAKTPNDPSALEKEALGKLKMAKLYLANKMNAKAKGALELIVKKYPQTNAAKKAEALLEELK